jgi:Cdc6-like AAA superfamily ATPase
VEKVLKLKPGNFTPKKDEDWRGLELEARELFAPATPIDERDLFAGRIEKIDEMSEAVLERGRHVILYGERGVGKTSLTNIFHKILQRPTRNIFAVRIQCDQSDTFESIWSRAFHEFSVQYEGEVKRTRLSEFVGENLFPDDIRRLLNMFPPTELPIAIFDEFDRIRDPEVRLLMANTIKSLSDFASRATIIIVGVSDDVTSLIGEHGSIGRNLSQIRMPRMSNSELKEIVDKRVKLLGMRVTEGAKWKIVLLSRGLPTYAHHLGRHSTLSCLVERKLLIEESHVNEAVSNVLDQMQESCRYDYEKAVHSNKANLYREVLLACALIEKTDDAGYFLPSQITEPLSRTIGRPVEIANFHPHLAKFTEIERGAVLEKMGRPRAYRFRFRDPLLQPYIIMKGMKSGTISMSLDQFLNSPDQPNLI